MFGDYRPRGVWFLCAAVLSLSAISVGTAQKSETGSSDSISPQQVVAGAVPSNLAPDEYVTGVRWTGTGGVTVTVDELIAREAARLSSTATKPVRNKPLLRHFGSKSANPYAPTASQWPAGENTSSNRAAQLFSPVSLGPFFGGVGFGESGFIPPDSNGAVGPTQVMVTANGRFKVLDKTGYVWFLSISDATFFSSVSGGTEISDPHVRYDRLSGRWIISEINVPPGLTSNRIMIAVSSGSTITNASSFTFFAFQHDLVGPTPNLDTGNFADYDTLGVDANALYIGENQFTPQEAFVGTSGYVINKADLLAGTLTVTAFRGLAVGTGTGPFTPQGVDNDDPSSTAGYFIGVDNNVFSQLDISRIVNPGTAPDISGNLTIVVPSTVYPVDQYAQLSLPLIDSTVHTLIAAVI